MRAKRSSWLPVAGLAGLAWTVAGAGEAAKPAVSAASSSYYTVRPDDPKAVELTRERFGAVGDGVADDTAALQKAIDAVQEATGEGVVLVPLGRYRVSGTVYVWPAIRVIGYGPRRPAKKTMARGVPGSEYPAVRSPSTSAGRRTP